MFWDFFKSSSLQVKELKSEVGKLNQSLNTTRQELDKKDRELKAEKNKVRYLQGQVSQSENTRLKKKVDDLTKDHLHFVNLYDRSEKEKVEISKQGNQMVDNLKKKYEILMSSIETKATHFNNVQNDFSSTNKPLKLSSYQNNSNSLVTNPVRDQSTSKSLADEFGHKDEQSSGPSTLIV